MSNLLKSHALSPLDGRYYEITHELSDYFSEFAYFRKRLFVELQYLIFLGEEKIIPLKLSSNEKQKLLALSVDFSEKDFEKIKSYEKTTNHDVKALEYFLKDRLGGTSLSPICSFIHLGVTSDDINNLAQNLLIKEFLGQLYFPLCRELNEYLLGMAKKYKGVKMLGRTHGQAAVPTTMGKELGVFNYRLNRILKDTERLTLSGKLNGAVGNFNALSFVFPKSDWLLESQKFVGSLGLKWNALTTQIEPSDSLVNLFTSVKHLNSILIGLCQDIWYYQSIGYFKILAVKDEVGSSTMPQKINPIDFENAEGNLQLSNALFSFFSDKLPISRLQRDLSDSTVKRNIGVAFGHTVLALKTMLEGLAKLDVDDKKMAMDLNANWSILSEAVQVYLRANDIGRSYELVKDLTRGAGLDKKGYLKLINSLPIKPKLKTRLSKLTPETYLGLSEKLVDLL